MNIDEKIEQIGSEIKLLQANQMAFLYKGTIEFLTEYQEELKKRAEYRDKVVFNFQEQENVYDYFSSVDIKITMAVSKNVWKPTDIIKKFKDYITKELKDNIKIYNYEQHYVYYVGEYERYIGLPLKTIFETLSKTNFKATDLGSDTESYEFEFNIHSIDTLELDGEE